MPHPVALITGASRGIGLATAQRFARNGYRLALVARDAGALATAAAAIPVDGERVRAIAADLADAAAARRVVAETAAQFGRVDVLVNNAGVALMAPIADADAGAFDRMMAVNTAAIFHATQAVWPIMQKQGGGVIVNISSRASVDPFEGLAAYGASKAWVNLFSQAAAAEGKPHGIRVYAVAPGAVETRMLRGVAPNFPVDAALDPDAVAAVIETVCSEAMAPASGQTVFVRR